MTWTATSSVGQPLAVLLGKESVGVRIRQARDEAGLTQAELARRIGLQQPQQVSNYERGVSEPPPPRLRQIADATKRPLVYFFHGTEDEASVLPFPGQDHPPALLEQVARLEQLVREQMEIVKATPGALEGMRDVLAGMSARLDSIDARLAALESQPAARAGAVRPRRKPQQ